MNKQEFKLAFINYCNDGGHGYDPYDIAVRWDAYQKDPKEFDYLIPYKEKE